MLHKGFSHNLTRDPLDDDGDSTRDVGSSEAGDSNAETENERLRTELKNARQLIQDLAGKGQALLADNNKLRKG